MSDDAEIVLRFRALPDDVPLGVRVRRVLKYALRSERLRLVHASMPPEPPRGTHQLRQDAGDGPRAG